MAGQRRHLGNAGAHRPGADHAHRLQSRQSSHIHAQKARRAFFHKGGHAFGVVGAPAQLAHQPAFQGELLLQGVAGGGVHGQPGAHQRLGGMAARRGQRIDMGANSPSATQAQIKFPLGARAAGSLSASKARPMARAMPTRCGSAQVAPVSGIRPILLNACRNDADSPPPPGRRPAPAMPRRPPPRH